MQQSECELTLAEAIEDEKEFLLPRYAHSQKILEQIEAYLFEVSMTVNETLESKSGEGVESKLEDICHKLEISDQLNASGIPPEIQRFAVAIRARIRKRILMGEVALSRIPIAKVVEQQ